MIFNATIDNDKLKDVVQTAHVLVDEARIHIEDSRIWIRAVDPANVGMVETELEADAFESYAAEADVTIGVNLNRLADILSLGNADTITSLELDMDTHKLKVTVDGVEYTLALIDTDSIRNEPDLPDLDLPNKPVVEWNEIDRGLTAGDMVSDHVELACDEEGALLVKATGDTDDVLLRLVSELEDESEFTDDTSSLFSLDYFKDMSKGVPEKDTPVTLHLGNEFPLNLVFEYNGGNAETRYMLAPRIRSN